MTPKKTEKLQSGLADATEALARQGRSQEVRDNLRVKEVRIRDDERFVIYFNPKPPTVTPTSANDWWPA